MKRAEVLSVMLSTPALLLLVLVSVIGAAPFLPLFDLDEGAFAEATREMLASGNWVSTYLNGEPRYDKPILIYWFQALSATMFGVRTFAFRLPSLCFAAAWLWVCYCFARQAFDDKSARYTLWIMCCGWLTTIIFKAATADALLNLLLTLTFFQIYRYWQAPEPKKLLWLGLTMGLGFLTKGPVAVILPALASAIAFGCCGQIQQWSRAVLHPLAWGSVLVVIAPWHIAVYLDQGWGFFEGFYLGHNISRFSDTMEGHGGSPWYYMVMLPLILLPFARQLFLLLAGAGRRGVAVIREQQFDFKYSLFWSWFLVTFVLFSFSKTQLPHYLLYGLSPVFMLLANRLVVSSVEFTDVAVAAMASLMFAVVLFVLPHALPSIHNPYQHAVAALANDVFRSGYHVFALLIAGFILLTVVTPVSNASKVLLCSLAMMLSTNFVLAPVVANAQQTPVKEAALLARNFSGRVVSYKANMPSFSVYSQKIVPKNTKPEPGDWVFTRINAQQELSALAPNQPINILYAKGGIALCRIGNDQVLKSGSLK
jgi:4-amino-4-deoxy-L-arabinose transferase-like glycosyltransferase